MNKSEMSYIWEKYVTLKIKDFFLHTVQKFGVGTLLYAHRECINCSKNNIVKYYYYLVLIMIFYFNVLKCNLSIKSFYTWFFDE